ncbi:DUF4198 domain-containing protein [Emticicia sp. BO119]|uniref:DUF4198 domain-containing protein n=1 Tax=Emticicia sp. BO119 TaxID=2757768 RepID=UPI0015EFE51C|nr:DUF4198 domain-containing protein [Emticicia sp. BO119]MBA4853417.1 DUF4198 domain-containing protein [Emticicia sp. BO119]
MMAHEFWLEPCRFILEAGEKLQLKIFVGEGFAGEEIDFTKFKVAKYTHYTPDGERNTSGSLNEQQLNDFLRFEKEGNLLIALNNTNKHIELEADKFNDYLKEEGLEGILAWRKSHNALNKKGREMYQRCVKTLIQVGKKYNEVYSQNTRMRLELIPQQNPYTAKQSLTFQVLFDNKPINKALVLVWQKGIEKNVVRKLRTDKSGKVSFNFEPQGVYMVSTVHMIPYGKTDEADWQSYWGSYTFGFK